MVLGLFQKLFGTNQAESPDLQESSFPKRTAAQEIENLVLRAHALAPLVYNDKVRGARDLHTHEFDKISLQSHFGSATITACLDGAPIRVQIVAAHTQFTITSYQFEQSKGGSLSHKEVTIPIETISEILDVAARYAEKEEQYKNLHFTELSQKDIPKETAVSYGAGSALREIKEGKKLVRATQFDNAAALFSHAAEQLNAMRETLLGMKPANEDHREKFDSTLTLLGQTLVELERPRWTTEFIGKLVQKIEQIIADLDEDVQSTLPFRKGVCPSLA